MAEFLGAAELWWVDGQVRVLPVLNDDLPADAKNAQLAHRRTVLEGRCPECGAERGNAGFQHRGDHAFTSTQHEVGCPALAFDEAPAMPQLAAEEGDG